MTRRRDGGFTLLEALLALVLAVLLFGGISLYTGTWLGQWGRIIDNSSRDDNVAVVLDRLVEDLEAALPLHEDAGLTGEQVLFEGSSDEVSFVRPALGFDARAGLDQVTYMNAGFGRAREVIRVRRDQGSRTGGEDLPLLGAGSSVRFAYAGEDGDFLPNWPDARRLPYLVRVVIYGQEPRPWSRTAYARLRVEWPAACGRPDMIENCLDRYGR